MDSCIICEHWFDIFACFYHLHDIPLLEFGSGYITDLFSAYLCGLNGVTDSKYATSAFGLSTQNLNYSLKGINSLELITSKTEMVYFLLFIVTLQTK